MNRFAVLGALLVVSGAACANQFDSLRTVQSDPFELDRTEVTVVQFGACVNAHACSEPKEPGDGDDYKLCNWGVQGKESHPVNCVTWAQATAFCKWAGKRLPTEVEFHAAVEGSDKRPFPWGTHHEKEGVCLDRRDVGTCPVGSSPRDRSELGVLDLFANVSEWTSDSYCDVHANDGINCDHNYVVFGQSFDAISKIEGEYVLEEVCVSDKNCYNPEGTMSRSGGDDATPYVGFRCAR